MVTDLDIKRYERTNKELADQVTKYKLINDDLTHRKSEFDKSVALFGEKQGSERATLAGAICEQEEEMIDFHFAMLEHQYRRRTCLKDE